MRGPRLPPAGPRAHRRTVSPPPSTPVRWLSCSEPRFPHLHGTLSHLPRRGFEERAGQDPQTPMRGQGPQHGNHPRQHPHVPSSAAPWRCGVLRDSGCTPHAAPGTTAPSMAPHPPRGSRGGAEWARTRRGVGQGERGAGRRQEADRGRVSRGVGSGAPLIPGCTRRQEPLSTAECRLHAAGLAQEARGESKGPQE